MADFLNDDNLVGIDDLNGLLLDDDLDGDAGANDSGEQDYNGAVDDFSNDVDFDDQDGVDGDNNQDDGTDPSSAEKGASPKANSFYSSIALIGKEEGIFPDLDDEKLAEIKTAEDVVGLIHKQVESRFDETQKRILSALDNGVEPNQIRDYENVISHLDSLKEEDIRDEVNGEVLRKNLIFNSLKNMGLSEQRAQEKTERIFKNGTDIEEALDALDSNRDFYKGQYSKVLEEAKANAEAEKKALQEKADAIKKSIVEDNEPFAGINVGKELRKRAFEALTKPAYKTADGQMVTALQKAQLDDPVGFTKNLSMIYTLTDGFKDFSSFVKTRVKQETKKGFKAMEDALKTSRGFDGEPRYVSSVPEEGGDKQNFEIFL